MKICIPIIIAALTLPLTQSAANAATSGWIDITKVRGFMTRLGKQNMLPTDFRCKNNPASKVSPLVKVTYRRNAKKQSQQTQWVWGWGNGHDKRHRPLLRAGFKRVSYTEAPGLFRPIKCGLWHRKPKK